MTYITNNYKVEGQNLIIDEAALDLNRFPYIKSKMYGFDEAVQDIALEISEEEVKAVAVLTEDADYVEINHIEVAEDCRQNGYGRQLVEELIAEYKSEGKEFVCTTSSDIANTMFWQRNNFNVTEKLQNGGSRMSIRLNNNEWHSIAQKMGYEY